MGVLLGVLPDVDSTGRANVTRALSPYRQSKADASSLLLEPRDELVEHRLAQERRRQNTLGEQEIVVLPAVELRSQDTLHLGPQLHQPGIAAEVGGRLAGAAEGVALDLLEGHAFG